MTPTGPLRDLLRSLPVFAVDSADFDPESVPDEPAHLFADWLAAAIDAGVPEPHAMTMSTCDSEGRPDARTLILKDVDGDGWWFSTASHSAKGLQLASQPSAALTFYGPPRLGRFGCVDEYQWQLASGAQPTFVREASARERWHWQAHRARRWRAEMNALSQCMRLSGVSKRCQNRRATWTLCAVVADTVEFWQADQDRHHIRVQYRREGDRWTHTMLWP